MQMQADMFNKQIEVRSLDTCWGVANCVKNYEKWAQIRDQFYGWKHKK